MNETIPLRLERYQRLRALQRELHHTVMKQLPREALKDCGMRLGIWRNGILVFASEDETSVLMDYCLYDYRWDGRNVIERYVADTPPQSGTDERILLDAMLKARYSLFEVERTLPGAGICVRDVLGTHEEQFIMDVGMSQTAVAGFVLAARIITPVGEGFSMTTGAGLPVDERAVGRILDETSKRFGDVGSDLAGMSTERRAQFSACVIRILLEEDASSRIAYTGPRGQGTASAGAKTGRNDPCPCGSGKKYKRCCGRSASG
jgi:hypothetical protein